MAELRGNVHFSVRGQELTMRVGLGAMERFSAATGKAFVASVNRLDGLADDPEVPGLLASLAQAVIEPRQEREAVVEIIDDVGLKRFMELFASAVKAAFPDQPEGEAPPRP